MYILSVISRTLNLFTGKAKLRLVFLMIFFFFTACIQVAGVASIAPFIGVLSNPSSIETQPLLKQLYVILQCQSYPEFVFYFGLGTVAMILISNGSSAVSLWILLRFSVFAGFTFQNKIFSAYLRQSYHVHKTSNFATFISMITSQTPRFVYMILQPLLNLFNQFLVAVIILTGLLFFNPVISISAAILIGGAYLLTYIFLKKTLSKHGKIISRRNDSIHSTLNEVFLGIKDVKLNDLENHYEKKFSADNIAAFNSIAFTTLAGDIPKFIIETLSFSAIIILALVMLHNSTSGGSDIISSISIYTIAGYKLLPTMQQIYKSVSSLNTHGHLVFKIQKIISLYENVNTPVMVRNDNTNIGLSIRNNIDTVEVTNITYKYAASDEIVLNNVSCQFCKGDLTTIAGPSGSGKSTFADIMLGLLIPVTGNIHVNGVLVDISSKEYRSKLAYVAQHVFILDDSVTANVAFGTDPADVDHPILLQALKLANAWEFVEKLPQGINTKLGQDGKLLSGGQRQRIGIARALYKNSQILILDEPSSALDLESEYALMESLQTLKNELLVIIISHRPGALKYSDKLVLLENGKICGMGNYEELKSSNQHFKDLVKKGLLI